MRKTMGYFLIIVGIIAVIGGIVMLSGSDKPSNENKPLRSTSQKTANVVPSTPAIAERQGNKKNDTIVVEKVVEKIIEKEAPKEEVTIKKRRYLILLMLIRPKGMRSRILW